LDEPPGAALPWVVIFTAHSDKAVPGYTEAPSAPEAALLVRTGMRGLQCSTAALR